MRYALLVALAALAGCDSAGGDDPAWTDAGSVAPFDFEVVEAPSADLPSARPPAPAAGERVVTMRVLRSPRWRETDRYVEWSEARPGAFPLAYALPLQDADVEVRDDGLRVVVRSRCSGGGWASSSSNGALSWLRVPRASLGAGYFEAYVDCDPTPGRVYRVTGTASVTVPAGTFDAVVVEDEASRATEYWSWDVGLVRYDLRDDQGRVTGRLVRSAGS